MRLPVLLGSILSLLPMPLIAAVEDFRFKVETLAEGMPQPMELELAHDGRIYFNEIGGKLRILDPRTRTIIDAGTLNVFTQQEGGFLGFALDPQFAKNGYVYCLYSPLDFEGQRLSRFTIKDDQLDLASEVKVIEYGEQRRECCHHAGTVEFGPDGCLYWSSGDNTFPHGDSKGYAPIDHRPEMFPRDAEKSSANTNDLRGKINRIRVKPDGSYEIPEGNLFPPGMPKTRPEIYAMGCRNPWRFSIDPVTGYLYYGDVGPDASEDGPRGPRGYDELNQVRKPGNFGWPLFIGPNLPYARHDFATGQTGAKFDPAKPVNESPNNTGLRELPPAQPAWIYWPYKKPTDFTELGEGGRTACGGPVFHWKEEFAATNGFPREFDRCLLFWDWQRPFIRWARMDANSNLVGTEPFTTAVVALNDKEDASTAGEAFVLRRPVDAVFGPDGCLYLMDYGLTWGANKDAKIVRISYLRGNLPPIAKITADRTAGREPLVVTLGSAGSRDPEGTAVKYEWRLGEKVISTDATAKVTLTEVGTHRVELRVSDAEGATGSTMIGLNVGNTAPTVRFAEPEDGDFFTPGRPVKFKVVAADAEDGNSEAKPDEFGFRTLVSSSWRTYDGKEGESDPGLSRMKQSDCFNCHAVEQPIAGPALLAIADRYRGQPNALETAAKRVLHGSTGVWGQVAMLPHPQHSEDEIALMVRWIFSLDARHGIPGLARGLTGEFTAPRDNKVTDAIFEATFTDAGRDAAAPLSGKTQVVLRARRIEADRNDGLNGPRRLGSGGCTNKYCLGAIAHGHSVMFKRIDLSDVGAIKIRAASGGAGGKVEIRTGATDGPLLATLEVPNTGGWDKWIEPVAELASGEKRSRSDIHVVFVNPGKGGLMNLDWIEFMPR